MAIGMHRTSRVMYYLGDVCTAVYDICDHVCIWMVGCVCECMYLNKCLHIHVYTDHCVYIHTYACLYAGMHVGR